MVLQDVLYHVFLQAVLRGVLGEFVGRQSKGCIKTEYIQKQCGKKML
jgi:hypothetical protein